MPGTTADKLRHSLPLVNLKRYNSYTEMLAKNGVGG